MIRTRVAIVAALTTCLAVLSACGSNGSDGPRSSAADAVLAGSLSYLSGTAKDNNAPADTGDFYRGARTDPPAMKWVQVSVGSANGLNNFVHDGAGFTLYRFDNDTASPSKSNCNGDCAKTWPPVLVQKGSKVFLDGVAKDQIGAVRRSDDSLQLTIGHWPVYRFSGDTQPGQTNGEGVKGVWFAVSPKGEKVKPADVSRTTPSASAGGSASLGNGSVILDSGKNFTEPDGSEGASGPGCVNLAQPKLASSIVLNGGPIKIWTGRDCTGTSAVVTASVPDLGAIGFDKKVVSIRFGG